MDRIRKVDGEKTWWEGAACGLRGAVGSEGRVVTDDVRCVCMGCVCNIVGCCGSIRRRLERRERRYLMTPE